MGNDTLFVAIGNKGANYDADYFSYNEDIVEWVLNRFSFDFVDDAVLTSD